MTFDFLKGKRKETPVEKQSSEIEELELEDLDGVSAGHSMNQDDINKILGESAYIKTEKRSELDTMFEEQDEKRSGKRR